MNKQITTILLCICMLFAVSGVVQAATESPVQFTTIDSDSQEDSQELQTQGVKADPAIQPNVIYQTHIQDIGSDALGNAFNGAIAGTTGKNLRLEGIRIFVEKYSYDLGVEYQTHIQNIGWEEEAGLGLKTAYQFSGTEGRSLRLEGIKIKLTGADADKFDIIYRTHIENIGWETEWKKNGEMSGTEGRSLKLEAIVIKIVPKGTQVPAGTPVTPDMYENVNDGCNEYPVTYTNYVPWKVNFDNSNCEHHWEGHFWHYVTYNNDQLLKYNETYVYPGTNRGFMLTPLYEADVAHGCQYNFVEWKQGHGNTKYPGGIDESLPTMYNLTADRYATTEEMSPFTFNFLPAFYYCTKCGQTSLGHFNKYFNK